ncbi:hypothetical protein ACIO93_36445 [Streptomyces sp. NPDC087903]|uniref:hypothetical protein n=1 Tax=Streptomyces sp. NPDC087903 TaxID=3365819 RepID=UPI0038141C7E
MLATQVRHALSEAGFHLVADTEGGMPGLWVSQVAEGVLVRWVVSDSFAALAGEQPGRASSDGMEEMVQAAVSGLLMQRGHIVTAAEGGIGIIVLSPAAARSRQP